jgi:hypothetical protein
MGEAIIMPKKITNLFQYLGITDFKTCKKLKKTRVALPLPTAPPVEKNMVNVKAFDAPSPGGRFTARLRLTRLHRACAAARTQVPVGRSSIGAAAVTAGRLRSRRGVLPKKSR